MWEEVSCGKKAEVAREFGVSPGFVRIIRHRGLAKERKAAKRM